MYFHFVGIISFSDHPKGKLSIATKKCYHCTIMIQRSISEGSKPKKTSFDNINPLKDYPTGKFKAMFEL